jgi:elongation factor G
VLEPIVTIDVLVPDSQIGDLTGELSARRAHIRGTDMPRSGVAKVSALAPMSELEGFPARLKSLTAGEGSYTLEFSHYEPAPAQLQQRLAAAYKPQVEEA